MIPIYEPWIDEQEKLLVNQCLDTGWISSRGSNIELFEKELSKLLNVKHVVACSNGTVSLMLILASLGLKPGDKVLVPSLTYAATVSQIIWLGLIPVLFDSDENYQPSFGSFLTAFQLSNNVKAVILPELYGNSPNIKLYVDFCNENSIHLIEDSAEVFASKFNGKHLGTFGIAGSFSFFSNKVITTGEGGCVVTNDDDLADRLRLLRTQAHRSNFIHEGPGFNFRMTNIQAAIGLGQLSKLDRIIKLKKDLAQFYEDNLPRDYKYIEKSSSLDSSEWMPLYILPEKLTYLEFNHKMSNLGIDTRPCFCPIHKQPFWTYEKPVSLSVSENIYSKGFNLPSYPTITKEQREDVINALELVTR